MSFQVMLNKLTCKDPNSFTSTYIFQKLTFNYLGMVSFNFKEKSLECYKKVYANANKTPFIKNMWFGNC